MLLDPNVDPYREVRRKTAPASLHQAIENFEMGIGRAHGRIGLRGVLQSRTLHDDNDNPRPTQHIDSDVAPYRCGCDARRRQMRDAGATLALRRLATWTLAGADDGIRTRDPRLGKKGYRGKPHSPTCTFAN